MPQNKKLTKNISLSLFGINTNVLSFIRPVPDILELFTSKTWVVLIASYLTAINELSNDYKDFHKGYNAQMSFQYKVFQINLSSELAFPELLPLAFHRDTTDVTIRFGSVSTEGLTNPIKNTPAFQAKKNEFWMTVPGVSRFLVTQGREIIIDPFDEADEASIRIFLLGSCFGALLMQRGFFVLHGNAVKIGPYALSITGLSGAGKSTLAGSLAKRGYSILADDVCAINAEGEILPSFPQIKLWADSAKKLSIETAMLRKVRPDMEKFAIPLKRNFYVDRLPLKLIYILNSHHKDTIEIKNLTGFEKFKPLRSQTYRLPYIKGLDLEYEHKVQCTCLAGRVALAQITRPDTSLHLEKLTDYIESDLDHRGFIRG